MHDGSGRITVQSLTKQFGPVTAVQNLSFTVEPGSVTGFLGPNGAGKTTTLRTVLGLVSPTAGTTTINGVHFTGLGNPARVVGAVLEAQGFHPRRSARDHLRVYGTAIGMPDRRVEEVLQLVGLGPAAGLRAGGFSLGMKQRLALATALLGDPQILVLDEPANGLDPEGIAWLRAFLQAFARNGRTVLISSHLLAEVEQTVDHVVIISRGQTMYNGPLDHLRRSQQSRVFIRPSDSAALTKALRDEEIYNIEPQPDGRLAVGGVTPERVADIALRAGVSVYGIEEERVNLEQLYFALTNGQYSAGALGGFGAAPTPPGAWGGTDSFQPNPYGQAPPQPHAPAQLPPEQIAQVYAQPPQQYPPQQYPPQAAAQSYPAQQFPTQNFAGPPPVAQPVPQQYPAQPYPPQDHPSQQFAVPPFAPQPFAPQPGYPPQQPYAQQPYAPPQFPATQQVPPGYPQSGGFPAQQQPPAPQPPVAPVHAPQPVAPPAPPAAPPMPAEPPVQDQPPPQPAQPEPPQDQPAQDQPAQDQTPPVEDHRPAEGESGSDH